MAKLQYRYINPNYLINNSILTREELLSRKIWLDDETGVLSGRQYVGLFLVQDKYFFWIPEKSINNIHQDAHVTNDKPFYYRFTCDNGKYLYLDKSLLVPIKFTRKKEFLSKLDHLKLKEVETNINIVRNKIQYCIRNNKIENYELMKSIYDKNDAMNINTTKGCN